MIAESLALRQRGGVSADFRAPRVTEKLRRNSTLSRLAIFPRAPFL